jgi:hypothetical protein
MNDEFRMKNEELRTGAASGARAGAPSQFFIRNSKFFIQAAGGRVSHG